MTTKSKNCGMCGRKLIGAKGPLEGFTTKNFGDDKNPQWKIVCNGCDAKFRRVFGAQQ